MMVALTLETTDWYRIILQWYNVAEKICGLNTCSSHIHLTWSCFWGSTVWRSGLCWCRCMPSRSWHFDRWRRSIHCHWDSWSSRCDRNTWNSLSINRSFWK